MGTRLVLEATKHGLILTPWEKWRRKNTLVHLYRVSLPERLQEKSFLDIASLIGTPYDNGVVLWLLIRRPPKKSSFVKSKTMLCHEVVLRFLHRTGDPRFKFFNDYGNWWPEKLLKALKNHPLLVPVETD